MTILRFRLISWTLLTLVGAALSASPTRVDAAIAWEGSLVGAWKKAVQEGKPLVVYYFSSTCPHCKRFNAEVISQQPFAALASRAIFFRADAAQELEASASKLADSLQVSNVPAIFVLNVEPDTMKEVGRSVGYVPATEFLPRFSGLLDEWQKGRKGAVQKPSPAPPTKEPPPAQGNTAPPSPAGPCSITNEALGATLRKLGLKPKRVDLAGGRGCMHHVALQREGESFDVIVANVPGHGVWIGMPLVKLNVQRTNAASLVKLLEANTDIFPAQFHCVPGEQLLYVSQPVDERDIRATDGFRSKLDHVVDLGQQRKSLWESMGTR